MLKKLLIREHEKRLLERACSWIMMHSGTVIVDNTPDMDGGVTEKRLINLEHFREGMIQYINRGDLLTEEEYTARCASVVHSVLKAQSEVLNNYPDARHLPYDEFINIIAKKWINNANT